MNPVTSPAAVQLPEASIRATVRLPIRLADGTEALALAYSFHGLADARDHLALKFGQPGPRPLVRLHSECMTGDVFGSLRCDCGPQLQEALRLMSQEGGYLLYLRQEGRGIGLYSKLDAYRLQELGYDTYTANLELGHGLDDRDYTPAAQMLRALGADRVRLLTNNPDKAAQLARNGVTIVEQIPTEVHLSADNARYLTAKATHSAHTIALPMGD